MRGEDEKVAQTGNGARRSRSGRLNGYEKSTPYEEYDHETNPKKEQFFANYRDVISLETLLMGM